MVQLPFLSKSKDTEEKFLTLDICSTEVKCLAFYYDTEENNLKIIGSGQKSLDQGAAKSGFIIDEDAIEMALEESIAQASQNLENPVNKVIISAPADLCHGLMTTVRAKRKKEKAIDKKELGDIYAKLRDAAFIQAQKDYLEITGDNNTELESIMETTVYAKTDNQLVKDLEGQKSTNIEMAIFNAFSPKIYLDNLQSIAKKTGLQILTIVPALYGIVQTILKTDHNLTDFVVLDISNDTTNAAVVFGKGIVSTKSLSIGMQHFTEGIMERMGLTYREADRLLKSYVKGQLTPSEGNIIRESLKDVIEVWLSGLELMFTEYTGVKTFPSKIFLTGIGAEIPELWSELTTEPWTKSIPFREPPIYQKMTFLEIKKLTDSTGKVSGAEWVSLAALSTIYTEMKGFNND